MIRNVLGLHYKNRENLIISLGLTNVIGSPVVYRFAATPATNSTILYQENCVNIIRVPFVTTVMGFVEFQN